MSKQSMEHFVSTATTLAKHAQVQTKKNAQVARPNPFILKISTLIQDQTFSTISPQQLPPQQASAESVPQVWKTTMDSADPALRTVSLAKLVTAQFVLMGMKLDWKESVLKAALFSMKTVWIVTLLSVLPARMDLP